jgi:hypothetical protein
MPKTRKESRKDKENPDEWKHSMADPITKTILVVENQEIRKDLLDKKALEKEISSLETIITDTRTKLASSQSSKSARVAAQHASLLEKLKLSNRACSKISFFEISSSQYSHRISCRRA